jgi:hypothetical protein
MPTYDKSRALEQEIQALLDGAAAKDKKAKICFTEGDHFHANRYFNSADRDRVKASQLNDALIAELERQIAVQKSWWRRLVKRFA